MKNSDITPLFGLDNAGMPHNQVFPETEYHPLLTGLVDSQKAGGLAMHAMTHTTVTNDWFGIQGGKTFHILWVYTAPVKNWICQLASGVQQTIQSGIEGNEPLADFPNYKTADENGLLTINLTGEQAALLADMYAWSIDQEISAFVDHLPSPPVT